MVGGEGAVLRVRMECLTHCSQLQPYAPVASTALPAMGHGTFKVEQVYRLILAVKRICPVGR